MISTDTINFYSSENLLIFYGFDKKFVTNIDKTLKSDKNASKKLLNVLNKLKIGPLDKSDYHRVISSDYYILRAGLKSRILFREYDLILLNKPIKYIYFYDFLSHNNDLEKVLKKFTNGEIYVGLNPDKIQEKLLEYTENNNLGYLFSNSLVQIEQNAASISIIQLLINLLSNNTNQEVSIGFLEQRFILNVIADLENENERSALIVGAAKIDVLLEEILAKFLLETTFKKGTNIFDFNSALGTFSSKIMMSFSLGLIDKNFATILDKIRELRNDCAHLIIIEPFNDNKYKNKIENIQKFIKDSNDYNLLYDRFIITKNETQSKLYGVICFVIIKLEQLLSETNKIQNTNSITINWNTYNILICDNCGLLW